MASKKESSKDNLWALQKLLVKAFEQAFDLQQTLNEIHKFQFEEKEKTHGRVNSNQIKK